MKQTLTPPSLRDSHHAPPSFTLSFDLIQQILCRLPVKSLIRFQCVCKSWKSLISNNYEFAKKHLHMSLNRPQSHHLIINVFDFVRGICWDSHIPNFFNDSNIAQTRIRYPPILNVGTFKVIRSCHGIVSYEIPYYVVYWNPSIRKFKISPVLDYSSFKYGFGYDHSNDCYKMVAISFNDDDGKTQVNVHTLGTNCWRRIQEFPCGVPVGKSGIFVGGAVNWVSEKYWRRINSPLCVVSLDLGNESYRELFQPDYGEVKLVGLTLGELRDCLCIFAHHELIVDVWVMKEYGNKDSWNKLFTIPHVEDLGYPGVNFRSCVEVACIYEDEQVLLLSRNILNPKLVIYDSRSDTFRIPKIEKTQSEVPTIYIESLITTC